MASKIVIVNFNSCAINKVDNIYIRLANNRGKAIIVAIIADCFLPYPKNLDTVRHIPDLLTPGINAIACMRASCTICFLSNFFISVLPM